LYILKPHLISLLSCARPYLDIDPNEHAKTLPQASQKRSWSEHRALDLTRLLKRKYKCRVGVFSTRTTRRRNAGRKLLWSLYSSRKQFHTQRYFFTRYIAANGHESRLKQIGPNDACEAGRLGWFEVERDWKHTSLSYADKYSNSTPLARIMNRLDPLFRDKRNGFEAKHGLVLLRA
jgi:hypothetical protein